MNIQINYLIQIYTLLIFTLLFHILRQVILQKMDKQCSNPYIDHSSWLDCLGDLNETNKLISISSLKENNFQEKKQIAEENQDDQQMLELISLHQCVDKELFKRHHPDTIMQEDFFTSNSSSNDLRQYSQKDDDDQGFHKSGYRRQKYAKQYIYSKNYRQKKKEQFKLLQQQNKCLKNKIQELQFRLREKELQINRLKHHSLEKELTIEELNRQFLTKVSLFAEKIQKSIESLRQKQLKDKVPPFYDELIRTYDEHGFYGSRKRQILNYHFDQILQVVLRDSQKYLCMLCCKNKDSKFQKYIPEYQKIDNAFCEIMEVNQQTKRRLEKYFEFLHPIMKDIKKQSTDLYRTYQKIIESMKKVHQFMKHSYGQNLDFVKKRMKIQSWFEYHKYHKIMRRLKDQWLAYVKNQKFEEPTVKKKKRLNPKRETMEEQKSPN